jgi:hypothetical protein
LVTRRREARRTPNRSRDLEAISALQDERLMSEIWMRVQHRYDALHIAAAPLHVRTHTAVPSNGLVNAWAATWLDVGVGADRSSLVASVPCPCSSSCSWGSGSTNKVVSRQRLRYCSVFLSWVCGFRIEHESFNSCRNWSDHGMHNLAQNWNAKEKTSLGEFLNCSFQRLTNFRNDRTTRLHCWILLVSGV